MCREVTEKYASELMNLSEVLLKAMSSTLGLDEDYLHMAFGGSKGISANMRVNYYPKCPEPELTLGLSSHSDPGGITCSLLTKILNYCTPIVVAMLLQSQSKLFIQLYPSSPSTAAMLL